MVTRMIRRRRLSGNGQTISEYGIVIGTVIFALIAMQTYIRRYVQAEIKSSADDFLSVANPMQTQRLSIEPLASNAGFNHSRLIGDYNTNATRAMVEEPRAVDGALVATTDTSVVERTGRQQVVQVRRMLPHQAIPPGRLFERPKDQVKPDVQRPGGN